TSRVRRSGAVQNAAQSTSRRAHHAANIPADKTSKRGTRRCRARARGGRRAAYSAPSRDELRSIREAVGVPLRVVRLSVPLPDIERRLAADVTTARPGGAGGRGRQDSE